MKFFAAIIIFFSMFGCSPNSDRPTAVETIQQDTVSNTPTLDEVYVFTLRDEMSLDGVSDSDIIGLGNKICSALKTGSTPLEVGEIGVRAGLAPYDAGYVVGASIAAYCPEFKSDL